VSTTSLEVRPRWRYRPSGPTVSATWLMNAITSWSVVCSISAIRSGSTVACSSSDASASAGMRPRFDWARATAISTRSICSNRARSVQTAPISASV
jgi:hypothetical protein